MIMSLRQDFLNTFAHKRINNIVFSPRIYYWYLGNKIYSRRKKNISEEIPSHFFGMSQLEIYKNLDASPRYAEETLYIPLYYEIIDPEAKIQVKREPGSKIGESLTKYNTPKGKLVQVESIG